MARIFDEIQGYWQNLRKREKLLLIAAMGVLVLFIFYFAAVRPLTVKTEQLQVNNERLQKDYLTIKNYKGNNQQRRSSTADRTASIEKAVDRLGKEFALNITKMARLGDKTSVELGNTDSASLLYFLNELERGYDIQVISIEIEPLNDKEIKVKGLTLGRSKKL